MWNELNSASPFLSDEQCCCGTLAATWWDRNRSNAQNPTACQVKDPPASSSAGQGSSLCPGHCLGTSLILFLLG